MEKLFSNSILPINKLDEFVELLFNKEQILQIMKSQHYLDVAREDYWNNGFNSKSGWINYKIIYSQTKKKAFSHQFYHGLEQDFLENGLQSNNYEKNCLYLPDILLFFDDANHLNDLIDKNHIGIKHWLANRLYYINETWLNNNIYSWFENNNPKGCYDIQKNYEDEWFFLTGTQLPQQQPSLFEQQNIVVGVLDFALILKAEKCLELLKNLIGWKTLAAETIFAKAPANLRNFWHYYHLKNETNTLKILPQKKTIKKI